MVVENLKHESYKEYCSSSSLCKIDTAHVDTVVVINLKLVMQPLKIL